MRLANALARDNDRASDILTHILALIEGNGKCVHRAHTAFTYNSISRDHDQTFPVDCIEYRTRYGKIVVLVLAG